MNFFKKTYYFFSDYSGPAEREVAKFFSKIHENQSYEDVRPPLIELIQNNIVAINLWTEYKYRQYQYLKKNERKVLYENIKALEADFDKFYNKHHQPVQLVLNEVALNGVSTEKLKDKTQKLIYLKSIMDYLNPRAGRYIYRESSTFGALLKDPTKEKLVGDCNQIVTLYIYLYSRKYDILDLQLKTYPGHVALHFYGIDIEATNGQFAKYKKQGQTILPIEEIVSLNMLDVTDKYYKTHKVSAEALLEASRVAYVLSSQRDIVEKNLVTAYNNAVVEMLKNNSYKKALEFAQASGDNKLVAAAGHNGAIYYMKSNDFKRAIKFAEYSMEAHKLKHSIYQNEGAYYFNKGNYEHAISAFENSGDSDAVKTCYGALFNKEQKKLGNIKTTEDLKANSKIIYNMDGYAKKSGNQSLINYVSDLKKYL
jgi:tetratricopeptide (TPR) repeat protein